MQAIEQFLKRNRSYSFWDICRFFLNFLITFFVFAFTLYFSRRLTLPQDQSLTTYHYTIIGIGAFVLVIFTYIREFLITRSKEYTIRDQKLIYDCFGGALIQLINLRYQPPGQRASFINELLKYVEKVVCLILKGMGNTPGEVCANLMIKKNNPERLELQYFGTFLSGRKKITLPIDPSSIMPGAPEAYIYGKVAYVDNTLSPKHKDFFDEAKPYRSIVSVPIPSPDDGIVAVLNIDSSTPYQFVSTDVIAKKILPAVSPFVSLLQLIWDLVLESSNYVSQPAQATQRR
jgi:hypothetical protein